MSEKVLTYQNERFSTLNETILINKTEYIFFSKSSSYPFVILIGINKKDTFNSRDFENKIVELEKEGKYNQMFLLSLLYAFQEKVVSPVTGTQGSNSNFKIPKVFSSHINDLFLSLEQMENFMDLKVQREASEDLAEQRKKLLEIRDAFFANMNHELRTPLNAILGFSEIMMKKMVGNDISDEYLDYAERINNSGKKLLNLINDLLNISSMNSGKFTLIKSNENINKVIEESIDLVSIPAKNKNIKIVKSYSNDFIVNVDKKRIEQVFNNILSNAIKFTANGGEIKVSIQKTKEGDGNENGYIEISFEDNGMGIKEENLSRILCEYERVTDGLSRENELQGTGLGLPIVKKIVELHKGIFSISSVFGKGTIVTVKLQK